MGNRSSLLAFRKKQKQVSAAKLPDTASSAAQLVPPLASARLPEQPQLSSREDSARDDALTPRPAHASGLDPDADPLEFFREAQSFAESGSSDHASLQYSQALCLQTKQEYAAASALYRDLISRESLVTLEAHFRLAQCILMQHSHSFSNNARQEAQESLEHVIKATSDASDDVFMERMRLESMELLAHFFTSESRFREALALYDSLPIPSPAVVFERAFCHHALSMSNQEEVDAAELLLVSSDDLALMQVDAHSICSN